MEIEKKLLARSFVVLLGLSIASAHFEPSKIDSPKYKPNPELELLEEGTWFAAQTLPSPGASGSHVTAYSRFVFDSDRGRIIKRGGGHCHYYGTEVQEFDAQNSLSWSIKRASVSDTEFLPANQFNDANYPGAVVVLPDGSAPKRLRRRGS